MTREELERIKSDYYDGVTRMSDVYPLWAALESSWARIDEVERQNLDLTVQRDDALKEGLALIVEKEGMQVKIEQLKAELEKWINDTGPLAVATILALEEELKALTAKEPE